MNEYQKFHIRRIKDMLKEEPAQTPQNEYTVGILTVHTIEDKLLKILSSLFEMGLIESYETYQEIHKAIIHFFQPPRCQTCGQVLP